MQQRPKSSTDLQYQGEEIGMCNVPHEWGIEVGSQFPIDSEDYV